VIVASFVHCEIEKNYLIRYTYNLSILPVFGRLRVRPSKTRVDPWFVRFKKARCDAGSPASTCGFLIPASGAFALFSPEEPQDARRSRETGCDFSLPCPRPPRGDVR
jgi:hypothetical protein